MPLLYTTRRHFTSFPSRPPSPTKTGTTLHQEPLGSGSAGLGSYVLSKAVAEQTQQYAAKASSLLNQRLAYDIRAFERQSPQRWEELRRGQDPEEIYRAFRETVHTIQSDPFSNIAPDQQQLVKQLYLNELGHALETHFDSVKGAMAVQEGQLKKNAKDIQGVAAAYVAMAEHQHGALKNILETQHSIQTDLRTLQESSRENPQNMQFIHEFMFGNMTPSQQRAALQRGMFPAMPQSERDLLDRKLALVEKREKFNEDLGKVLQGAGEVLNIAKNLGVDPKILGPLSKAVGIGNHVANGIAQFTSGNYLGAVSALSNVLGIGGGSDPDAERHKQVMQALQAIYGKLGVMDEKLNKLLASQEAIIKSQKLIYEAILTLSEEVERNHHDTMVKLRELSRDVLYNRDLILEPVRAQYANCNALLRQDSVDGTSRIILDTGSGIYPTFERFEELYRDRSTDCKSCIEVFSKVLAADDKGMRYNRSFALESANSVDGVAGVLAIYQDMITLTTTLASAKAPDVRNKWLNLALVPSPSVQHLETKRLK